MVHYKGRAISQYQQLGNVGCQNAQSRGENPGAAINPPNNDRFLEAIFGRITGIFTISFRGPMETADWRFNPFCSDPLANNYYCVSTLVDPTGRRTPENCAALYVLLVDDVHTKVDPRRAIGILGEPTYKIETSPGNEQWGYHLDPPDADPLHAEALVQAMVRCFTADAAGRNRVARLPYGTNGKNGHQSRLLVWDLDRKLTPDAAYSALEATPIDPSTANHAGALPHDQDPIIRAMNLLGHPYQATRTAGIYQVQCPWVLEHSAGRDDGAAYISPAGFNCFHGHCQEAGRNFADFRSFLGVGAQEVDGAIADREFGAKTVSDAGDGSAQPQEQTRGDEQQAHPWLSETAGEFAHESGRFLSRAELQEKFPIHWLFEGIVPMGVPWCIAGEGGLGKSRIMLSLCMSIASGVPWGPDFRPGEEGGRPVVFLTQEDDKPQRGHRVITQYEYLCQRDVRWDTPEVRERLHRNLYLPSLDWGQEINTAFRHTFKEFLTQMPVPPALVVFDPLINFWDHSDKEANINSAAGAVNTMRLLMKMVRGSGQWSLGVCHHVSKEGGIYGSAILTANLRIVLTVEMEKATGQVQLKVVKVNGSNLQGRIYEIDRSDDGAAAVFPRIPFESVDPEQKLAALLHSGTIDWDVPVSKLIESALKTSEFLRREAVEKIVTPKGVWHKGTAGSAERLAALGLEHAPRNRYKPAAGYSGEEGE